MCCLIKKKEKRNLKITHSGEQFSSGGLVAIALTGRVTRVSSIMRESLCHNAQWLRAMHITFVVAFAFLPLLSSLPSVVSSCRRPEFRFVVFFLFLLLLRSYDSDSSRCPDVVVYRASSLISPKDKGSEKQPSSATCTDPKKPFDFERCMRTARASHD